jgi:uncharacterized UBP type Zn finger protein
MMGQAPCAHVSAIQDVRPRTSAGCEECLVAGTRWVHLRLCLSCGHVGCCDNSPGRHATRHHQSTTHPIIQSFEPGESWAWCYPDHLMLDLALPSPRTTSRT